MSYVCKNGGNLFLFVGLTPRGEIPSWFFDRGRKDWDS